MPEINRYTQMPAPLVVNPISFEEFSRVPMAQAVEKGAGLAALSRISTDYDVDEADLGQITKMVSGLDQVKDGIVDKIANSNIDSQTVGEVLALKKQRDELYKTKINAAEMNKKIINNWRENVDRMTMSGQHPADYGELIKQRGYTDWQRSGGTFGVEGKDAKTYIPDFGVKYIDVDKDIRSMLEQASKQGTESTTQWGGGKTDITSEQGYDFLTTSGGGSKSAYSNLKNLNAAEALLKREYNDPNTDRGKFAMYAGKDAVLSDLNNRLDEYKRMFIEDKQSIKSDTRTKQLMGASNKNLPSQGTEWATKDRILVPTDNIDAIKYGSKSSIVDRTFKTATDINKDYVKKEQTGETPSSFLRGLGMVVPSLASIIDITNQLKSGKSFKDVSFAGPNYRAAKEIIGSSMQVFKNQKNAYKDKLSAITDLPFAMEDIVSKDKSFGKIVAKALQGDKNAIDATYDVLADYMTYDSGSIEIDPKIVTTQYTRTQYGLSLKGVNTVESAQDLFSNSFNALALNTGTTLDKKTQATINHKGKIGKMEVKGNIPLFSPYLIDKETGKLNLDYTGGFVVSDLTEKSEDNQGEFLTPLPEKWKQTPEYERALELNSLVVPLQKGATTSVLMTDDGVNYYPIEIRHDERQGQEFHYLYNDGTGYSELKDEDQARIVGPKFAKRAKLKVVNYQEENLPTTNITGGFQSNSSFKIK